MCQLVPTEHYVTTFILGCLSSWNKVTGWTAEVPFPAGARDVLFSKEFRPALSPTQPIQWEP
jgi:hypothetical protein